MDWSGIFNEIFSVIYNILYFGVIIGMIIIVILDNRNPVKTMAWILVLSFLPLVGLSFLFLLWKKHPPRKNYQQKKL